MLWNIICSVGVVWPSDIPDLKRKSYTIFCAFLPFEPILTHGFVPAQSHCSSCLKGSIYVIAREAYHKGAIAPLYTSKSKIL